MSAGDRHRGLTASQWWLVVGALLALGAVGVAALWWLPALLTRAPHIADPAARAKAISDARTGVVAFLAFVGAAGAGGLYFTSRTFQLTRTTQITERYSKAVDQLGDPSPEVCIGGIYALQRIMKDSREDEQAIVEVLCAFVRSHGKLTPTGQVPWPAAESDRDEFKPSFRLQAALKVLARPSGRPSPTIVPNLRDSDLRGARFKHAHLENAVFRRAFLAHAHFTGAHLDGAQLIDADLTRARFDGASLTGADLAGAWVSAGALTDSQLEGVVRRDEIRWVDPLAGTSSRGYRRAVVALYDGLPTVRSRNDFLDREGIAVGQLEAWRAAETSGTSRRVGRWRWPRRRAAL
ncbi:hypothetical protein CD790_30855 [Streptomyces sp. SAJ15]|nr:hypothetical protein CD790_30855 [Streptomyces sp. SAJ15]